MMARSDAAKYPAQYRYMAYRVHAAGRALAEPVHYDGRAETEALKARYADWLREIVSHRSGATIRSPSPTWREGSVRVASAAARPLTYFN